MTTFLLEKPPARAERRRLTIPGRIDKMGYKGVRDDRDGAGRPRGERTAVLGAADGVGRASTR